MWTVRFSEFAWFVQFSVVTAPHSRTVMAISVFCLYRAGAQVNLSTDIVAPLSGHDDMKE